MHIMVWILFLIAGMLVGGAWTAYRNESVWWTIVASVLAVAALGASLAWLVSEMRSV